MAEIIEVLPEHLDQLRNISVQTFTETFKEFNSDKDLQDYIDKSLNPEKLREEVMNPDSEFHLLKDHNKTIGYLKLNFRAAQTELKEDEGYELERIYILNDQLNKGYGQKLLDFAINKGRKMHLRYMWLGVWEKNYRALKFYNKNGFMQFDQHAFWVGSDRQIDLMMRLDLW